MTIIPGKTRSAFLLASTLLAIGLGGCAMPNSSNPTMEVTRAAVQADRASLDLMVSNPSDMEVEISQVNWSLQYGPMPVAEGVWTLGTTIPSKGQFLFSKDVRFTNPALDPTADRVELTGTMGMKTKGDSSNMSLKSAGFVAGQNVKH